MSIWDNINQPRQVPDQTPVDGEFFTIQFSTEQKRVACGPNVTLERALLENASELGYAPGRTVSWRNQSGVVPADTVGEAGVLYTASVSLESKGR